MLIYEKKTERYVIYTKRDCATCEAVKKMLGQKDAMFEERDVSVNSLYQEELESLVPGGTVPMIFRVGDGFYEKVGAWELM